MRARWTFWPRPGLLAAAAALALSGCLLQFNGGDFQSLSLHFRLTEEFAAGEATLVQTLHHALGVGIKKRFVRISGSLMPPAGSTLPTRVTVAVRTENASGGLINNFSVAVSLDGDGNFSQAKRFAKDIPADAMQLITVRPQGAAIPEGTHVWLCVDVLEKKKDVKQVEDCRAKMTAPPGDDVVVVEVRDNTFDPKRLRIQAGQTVRWVLRGADPTHTVTAMDGSRFNHAVGSLPQPGSFVEVRFGAEEDGRTFEYLCETHHDCCEMQGSVLVGSDAADPGDGYQ